MFYDNYLKLCSEAGVAPTKVLNDLGIAKGTIKNWKEGAEPVNRTKKLIADYFEMTVAELMEGKKEKPAAPKDDEPTEEEKSFLAIMRDLNQENRDLVAAQAAFLLERQQRK